MYMLAVMVQFKNVEEETDIAQFCMALQSTVVHLLKESVLKQFKILVMSRHCTATVFLKSAT